MREEEEKAVSLEARAQTLRGFLSMANAGMIPPARPDLMETKKDSLGNNASSSKSNRQDQGLGPVRTLLGVQEYEDAFPGWAAVKEKQVVIRNMKHQLAGRLAWDGAETPLETALREKGFWPLEGYEEASNCQKPADKPSDGLDKGEEVGDVGTDVQGDVRMRDH